MRGHLLAIAVWVGIVVVGYFLFERFTAPPPVSRTIGDGVSQITVPVARDGHFYLDGAVNNVPIRFMVDTGASFVAVSADFARKAGLPEGIPGYFSTANGTVEGRLVKHQSVRADVFEVSGLTVAVMPAGGEHGLLGQNFLRNFDVSQTEGKLVLRMRTQR